MVSVDVSEWTTWGVRLLIVGLCLVLVAGVGLYTLNGESGFGNALFALIYVSVGLLGTGFVTAGTLTVYRDSIHPGIALAVSTVVFVVLLWVTNTNWTLTGIGSLGAFVGVWALLYWKDARNRPISE